MTKEQVIGLMNLINTNYPKDMTTEERKAQLILWYGMLKHDDPEVVGRVINRHIALSKYKPTIAEIRKGIRELTMTSPAKLYDTLVTRAKQSMRTEDTLVERGVGGKADSYKSRSLKGDAFKALPDELKVYVQTPEGLQDWYKEWRYDEEATKKRFFREIEALQEEIDLQKVMTGKANPYMLGGAK